MNLKNFIHLTEAKKFKHQTEEVEDGAEDTTIEEPDEPIDNVSDLEEDTTSESSDSESSDSESSDDTVDSTEEDTNNETTGTEEDTSEDSDTNSDEDDITYDEFGNIVEDTTEEPSEAIERKRNNLIDTKLNELYDTYNKFYVYITELEFDQENRDLLNPSFIKMKDNLEILDTYIKENKKDLFAIKVKNLLVFRTSFILTKNEIDSIILEYDIKV